ncbi:MAG: ATP-binding protein [Candidatus Lernaella stagnicola]|nr:ATP-binding protein [Candidatus Lernaella stagnicola]
MKTLSIYQKLILYFLLVSLIPLAGFGAFSYLQLSRTDRGNFREMISLIAVQTAYMVERELESRRNEVVAWADLLPVDAGAVDSGDHAALFDSLDRLVTAFPMYDLLLVTDANHRVIATNRHDPAGRELAVGRLAGNLLSNGPWFSEAGEKGNYLSAVRLSNVIAEVYGARRESVNVAAPIRREGKTAGFLVAYLNWSYLQDILSVAQGAHADDLSGTLFMLSLRDNRYLAHPNADLNGQPYPLNVDLSDIVEHRPTGVLHLDWPLPKTVAYAQVRGGSSIGKLPWIVSMEVPDEVIYHQARVLRFTFVALFIFTAVVIITVVSILSRRISEPILRLMMGAQAIAAGRMDIELPVRSVDELGILANTFNQMSDSLRERDDQLRLSNQHLEEANRLKSQFLANVSHELRTPMNSIIGFTTLVLQRSGDGLPEQQNQNLVKVRRNALHLLKLLNSILDLSKIEAGGMVVVVDEFPMRSMLEGCTYTIAPLLEKRPIEISVAASDDELTVHTDRQKLQQILINLLGNAVKFTERGYIRVGYEVTAHSGLAETEAGPWVRIWVEDSGIGIHERELDNIFSEFRQVDGSPSRRYGGTGLGLSISKKLAKLLGGDILVQSEPGFGSTFTLVIPVRHRSAEPLVRDETDHPLPNRRDAAPPDEGVRNI